MGRPSKQKAYVDKLFTKYYVGNIEKRKCLFCKESYAYNAFRLAKHLLVCKKTDVKFQTEKVKIASLFKSTNNEDVSFRTSSSTTTFSNSLGAIIPTFLKNDLNNEESELMVENLDLVQNSNTTDIYEIIDEHIPISSTTSSITSNPNILKKNMNVTKPTTFSNKISNESNTRTLDGYVDRLINIQEQVITLLNNNLLS